MAIRPVATMRYAIGTQSTSCCHVIVLSASFAVTPPAPRSTTYPSAGRIQPPIRLPTQFASCAFTERHDLTARDLEELARFADRRDRPSERPHELCRVGDQLGVR